MLQKTSSDLWFIHGKYYDLTPFIASHPGGSTILEMAMGLEDATPCMESYHAFANREYIYKTMKEYQVEYLPIDSETREKTATKYTFHQNGFYMDLVRRARLHFGGKRENESLTAKIKTNTWWNLKVLFLVIVYCVTFSFGFLIPNVEFNFVYASVAGPVLVMIGFSMMHDASHFALGNRDSWKNKFGMRVWHSLVFWDPSKWIYHHAVRHHSFTGDVSLDPDVIHAAPFARKHLQTDSNQYLAGLLPSIVRNSHLFAMFQTLFLVIGLNYGQMLAYNFQWNALGSLWNLNLSKTKGVFPKFVWQYLISAMVIACQLYKGDVLATVLYWTLGSAAYGMCILADHDTFESAVENHVGGGQQEVDWGEIQVRHSSDFAAKGVYGDLFAEVFGAINLQIAHHLFPSVNHVHLRSLIPLIRETCDEYNIPYASHDTLFGALLSVSKTYKHMNQQHVKAT
jgi:fatty acid desaturase